MTKRMLSLLLALVMTLSLCVPALAADEFEAETVTEVEEQAPEAPAEPEAPEAEEVAEPAVEEPAVEEAVEVPEIAAALPVEAEDGPVTIALGTIEERVIIRLQNTLDLAKPYKAKVDAGELYDGTDSSGTPANGQWVDFDYVTHDPVAEFNTKYAEAERNLKGLTGEETGKDVTNASALKAAVELGRMLPKDGVWGGFATTTGYGSGWAEYTEVFTTAYATSYASKGNYLTDVVTTTVSTGMKDTIAVANIGAKIYAWASATANTTTGYTANTDKPSTLAIDTTGTYDDLIAGLDTGDWALTYRSNYRDALKAALKAAKEANAKITAGTAKYSDIYAIAKLVAEAKELEEAAALPNTSDADTLRKTAAATRAIIGQADFDKNDWVFEDSTITGTNTQVKEKIETAIQAAEALLKKGVSNNEFEKGTSYYKYMKALNSITVGEAIKENSVTVTLKSATAQQSTPDKPTPGQAVVTVKVLLNYNDNKDDGAYAWAYSVNGWFADMSSGTNGHGGTHTNGVNNIGKTNTTGNVATITAGTSGAWEDDGTTGLLVLKDANALKLDPVKQDEKNEKNVTEFVTDEDNVVLYLYKEKTTGTGVWDVEHPAKTFTINLPGDAYVGPGIAKNADGTYNITITYGTEESGTTTKAETKWTPVTTLSSTSNPFGSATSPVSGDKMKIKVVPSGDMTDDGAYAAYAAAAGDVVLALQKTGASSDISALENTAKGANMTTAGATLDLSMGPDNKASGTNVEGKLTGLTGFEIQLRVKNNGEAPVAHRDANGIAALTFDSLATWTGVNADGSAPEGMAVIEKLVEIASDLKKSDFQLSAAGYNKATLDEVFNNMIPDDVAKAKDLIAKAPTMVNSSVNRDLVIGVMQDFITAGSYINPKTPVTDALKLAIAEAGKFEDDAPYTAKSWIAFMDVLAEANALNTALTSDPDSKYQSEVDAMTAKLEAAIKGLTPAGQPDKTDLRAAIAAAQALDEEDYTEESWAALESALANAQAVEANEDATQTQINAALASLKNASEGLDMTPEAELAEAKKALQTAKSDAAALKEDSYTPETWAELEKALDNAEKLAADATAAQVKAAADAIEAAIKALKPAETTPTENPKDKWQKDADGDYHYYDKDGVEAKGWVFTGSKHGLWYYCDPTTGKLVTGFKQVKDPKEPKYDGWYYFTPSGDCIGAVTSGWQNVGGTTGWGYFEKRHNGHYGACTYTDSQGDYVKYQPKA